MEKLFIVDTHDTNNSAVLILPHEEESFEPLQINYVEGDIVSLQVIDDELDSDSPKTLLELLDDLNDVDTKWDKCYNFPLNSIKQLHCKFEDIAPAVYVLCQHATFMNVDTRRALEVINVLLSVYVPEFIIRIILSAGYGELDKLLKENHEVLSTFRNLY